MYDLELRFGLWKDVVRAYMYRHRSLNRGVEIRCSKWVAIMWNRGVSCMVSS